MFIKLLVILLILVPSAFAECFECHPVDAGNAVIMTAEKYLYVRERTNNNDAPEIDKWLKVTKTPKRSSYCASFVSSMFKETYESYNKKSPWPLTAGVSNFAEYCSKRPFEFKMVSTKKLKWGIDTVEPGDVISWKRGSSIFTGFGYLGHKGIGIKNVKQNIYTIEANTKAGKGGDQSGSVVGDMTYGHEGVYKRKRQLGLNTNFPIIFIIKPIKKEI